MKALSIIPLLSAFIGAGLVMKKPLIGAILMLGAALVIFLVFGFNGFSFFISLFLLLGGGFALASLRAEKSKLLRKPYRE